MSVNNDNDCDYDGYDDDVRGGVDANTGVDAGAGVDNDVGAGVDAGADVDVDAGKILDAGGDVGCDVGDVGVVSLEKQIDTLVYLSLSHQLEAPLLYFSPLSSLTLLWLQPTAAQQH